MLMMSCRLVLVAVYCLMVGHPGMVFKKREEGMEESCDVEVVETKG